jgi:uncharacterized protein (TIGR00251 family)
MPRVTVWEETDKRGLLQIEKSMPHKIQVRIKAIPRSKKQELIILPDGSLRVKLRSVPEKGKANRELIELVAGYYRVNKSSVTIIKGEFAREKIIIIGS